MSNPNYDRANSSADYFNAENQDIYHLTQATLAVAYEQRTANLIAFYGDGPVGAGDPAYAELNRQIVERLGLS